MDRDIYIRMAAQEKYHWWFCGRRNILKTILLKYAPKLGTLDILEAGCGTGGNFQLLSEFGNIKAFELDAEACEIAMRSGQPVESGSLPNAIPFEGHKFDLIVLFDVLEHVEKVVEKLHHRQYYISLYNLHSFLYKLLISKLHCELSLQYKPQNYSNSYLDKLHQPVI